MPNFPGGNRHMELLYCSNIPNSSACYFYNILSATTWLNANANYNCFIVIFGPEIQPVAYKCTDVFPHISVPPHSAPTLWCSQHIICFCSIFSITITSDMNARLHSLERPRMQNKHCCFGAKKKGGKSFLYIQMLLIPQSLDRASVIIMNMYQQSPPVSILTQLS